MAEHSTAAEDAMPSNLLINAVSWEQFSESPPQISENDSSSSSSEYRCDCGTLFSRRDSFIIHTVFCDTLAQESSRSHQPQNISTTIPDHHHGRLIESDKKEVVVLPPSCSPPPPPLTPFTGVLSPVQSVHSSGDLTRSIHDKLLSAFSKISNDVIFDGILQFWTPIITIDGRRLLSTDGQPFTLTNPYEGFRKYRLRSVEYVYNIDVNVNYKQQQLDINEQATSAPATSAFLNRFPLQVDIDKGTPLSCYALECGLKDSLMLPVCWPSQNSSCCIGVVECSVAFPWSFRFVIPKVVNKALQEVGLSIFQVQQRIPYQIIGGLKPTRDQIEEVLRIVCESNNIAFAQVWIPFENDSQTKDKFTFKLTGYCVKNDYSKSFDWRHKYHCDFCDMFPLKMGEDIVGKTLQDYKPRFCKLASQFFTDCSRLAICLRSTNTGEFDYLFEFVWLREDSYVILLKELLLALKKYLPSFKVASGAELDDEFRVIDFENSTTSEIKFEEVLAKNIQSPISAKMKYPQQQLSKEKPMVDNYVAHSETMCSATPWRLLSQEVTQQPFGNAMKEAKKKHNGDELVEEFNVIDAQNSRTSEIEFREISSPISTYMNYLQQSVKGIQMVDNYVAPSETTCTTTILTLLSREVTEREFGDTIDAATKKRNEPGDELDVPDVENSTRSEKILQENILLPVPEALERGKKPMVENYIAPSARKYKTAPILLSQEAIEHQYGNTMKEAAKTLGVSISTLKRKCKDFGISEWQGPNPVKRKVNDCSNQSYTNEEYDGAVQDSSATNKNENTLTIKAEYADDMIKFHLGISEATFITVVEEIGKKFKLTHGTYKLKYLDEDKDWIVLASDQDMSDCMKSSGNLGPIVVRLRVLPSTQPISG